MVTDPGLDCITLPRSRIPRRMWLVLGLTGGFMLVEAVGGWVSGSLALLADAGHMLTDVGAIGLALLTSWIAQRPASASKTYGYLRWEILAALINGAALMGIAAWVVIEGIGRLHHPVPIRAGLFLVIAGVGLAVNTTSLLLLHGTHRDHLSTRSVYLHVLGDLLGSVAALGAALVIRLTGWLPADPIASILLSLLILGGAWRVVRESTDILLEAVPAHISLPRVQQQILGVPGVNAVHDLHVWTVTSGMVCMSGHVVVPALGDHPAVLERIRGEMARAGIGHVTIQLETRHECLEAPEVAEPGHRHA